MTPSEQAVLRYHISQLDSADAPTRLQAGVEVCRVCGLDEAVRALAPDGRLRPPPSWPLVDIVPVRAVPHGAVLVCSVRTSVGGGLVEAEERVPVPIRDGALMEAVERGKRTLHARLAAFVVGS